MKKSDKKKMIYDAMALRLAVVLEWILGQLPEVVKIDPEDSLKGKARTLRDYFQEKGADEKQAKAVVRVIDERNKIAHPDDGGNYRPYLTAQDFRKVREDCRTIDELLMKHCDDFPLEKLPMSKLMFHSLDYDMGNTGDLIKHGALVHFVRWWFENNSKTKPLRFADPFGGCPWEIVENPEIKKRLRTLEKSDSKLAKCLWREGRYYNSGHIVNFAANQCGGKAMVRTSDACDIARSDLMASAIHADDMELLGKPHKCNDGYSILSQAGEFDLVLLDPYGDLLAKDISQFQKIHKAACDNPKTAFMVFVLDMQPWEMPPESTGIHKKHVRYLQERDKLSGMAFSLRCRKAIPTKHNRTYDAEILLISKEFAKGGGKKLRERLEEFKEMAKKVLFPHGDQKITIWGG